MLLLPTSVLKDGKGRQNNDEPDIFQNDHSERYAQMKNGFFKLIQAYMYTKDDEKAFFSTSWRQELNVSLKTSHMLKANRIPKVQKMNKGKNTFVVCMIDPVRLFHDMLQDLNNKDQKFKVKIVETEKRDSSNYVYNIERLIVDGKKNRDKNMEETIAYEISQRLGQ